MATVVAPDGTVIDVPASEAQRGLAAGEYQLQQGQRVNVVDAEGNPSNIDATEVGGALAGGWRLATDAEVQAEKERERFESTGQVAATAAEGAARGLSLGLSDLALSGLGADTEAMAKRREYNPGAALGGEIVGGVAPLLISGGGSGVVQGAAKAAGAPVRALARAGAATERAVGGLVGEGILGRALAVGAGGAVEGAAIGAGQAVSESVLQDEELTAERLIAGAKDGALLGGAIGAGAGGLLRAGEMAAEKVAPKLRELLSPQKVDDFINDHAFAAAKGPGGGKKFVREAQQMPGGTSAIGKRLLDEGVVTRTSTVDDIARAARVKKSEYGERVGSLVKQLDEAAPVKPTNTRITERVRKEVFEDLRRDGSLELKRASKAVERELDSMGLLQREGDDAAEIGFEALHKKRQAIDRIAYPKSVMAEPTQKQLALQKVRAIVEDEFNAAAERAAVDVGGDFAEQYAAAKAGYRDYRLVSRMSDDAIAKAGTNRNLSMSDMQVAQAAGIGEAMMGGGIDPGTIAVGLASGYLHKLFREHGAAFFAGSMHGLRKASRATVNVEKRTDSAVKRFFKGAGRRTKSATVQQVSKPRRQRFDETVELVRKQSRNTSGVIDRISQRMADAGAADAVTAAATATAVRAAQFLETKLPAPIVRGSDRQPHLDDTPRVASSEMSKFLRYADAVKDPISVVDALERGDLTREAAEALRQVYPKMYADLKQRVTDAIIDSKERIPRSKLTTLSILFDEPYHYSMEPGFILAAQQGPPQQQQAEGYIAPSARKPPDTAAQMQTNTQRISQ